ADQKTSRRFDCAYAKPALYFALSGEESPRNSQTYNRHNMIPSRVSPFPLRLGIALSLLSLVIYAVLFSACKKSSDPAGVWRGLIKNSSGEEVAFTLEVKREGDKIVGSLVNGDDRTVSTGGSFEGATLKLRYDFYDATLNATIDGEELNGTFTRQWQKQLLERKLMAKRETVSQAASDSSNSSNSSGQISGEWVMRAGEEPKISYWRAAFKQQGSRVRGTIIPPSGDWGEMPGSFHNNHLTLNPFDVIYYSVV